MIVTGGFNVEPHIGESQQPGMIMSSDGCSENNIDFLNHVNAAGSETVSNQQRYGGGAAQPQAPNVLFESFNPQQ